MMLRIGSLFSGIGGLEHGLERAGVGEVVFQAEIDPYCRAVLAKHWPAAKRYDDVRVVDGPSVDLVCGGFPCQPVSVAGARKGKDDARWLWPEYARIIRDLEPSWVVIENVPGLRSLGLLDVLRDLAALGFDAEWTTLSAADVGAPHLRRRLFLVASHTERVGLRLEPGWLGRACRARAAQLVVDGEEGAFADADEGGRDRRAYDGPGNVEDRTDAGRSEGVRGPEGRAAGNASGSGREGASLEPHEGRTGLVQRPGSDETNISSSAHAHAKGQPQPRGAFGEVWGWAGDAGWREPPAAVRGVDDAFSVELDGGTNDSSRRRGEEADGVEAPDSWRIAALGNAVVEQCAYVVGCAIVEALGL